MANAVELPPTYARSPWACVGDIWFGGDVREATTLVVAEEVLQRALPWKSDAALPWNKGGHALNNGGGVPWKSGALGPRKTSDM
jgi:hypothetical protein